MPEEIITGSGLVTVLGVKLLHDVCGPTAKYLGGELKSYTEAGLENLKRVFGNAYRRIEAEHKHDGEVPARVLKSLLPEAYFCEDEVQAQYLGGILASAKGPIARDDRAVSHIRLLSGLSTYQIRHITSSILRFFGGTVNMQTR
jgi:hypothetical protein